LHREIAANPDLRPVAYTATLGMAFAFCAGIGNDLALAAACTACPCYGEKALLQFGLPRAFAGLTDRGPFPGFSSRAIAGRAVFPPWNIYFFLCSEYCIFEIYLKVVAEVLAL